MALPIEGMTQEEKLANAFRPESSASEVFGASVEAAYMDGTLFSRQRINTINEFNSVGPKLSPDELNQRYPQLGGRFKEPTSALAAQYISDRDEEIKKRQKLLDNTSGMWKGTILPFIGGMVGSLGDPIDFTIGTVLGAGIGKAALMAKPAATAGSVFFEQLAGNMMQNTINETQVYKANQAELQEYGVDHAFTNIVLSSAFGAGLAAGGHALFKKLDKLGEAQKNLVWKTGLSTLENGKSTTAVLESIDKQLGKDFEVDPIMRDAILETMPDRLTEKYYTAPDMPTLLKSMEADAVSGELPSESLARFKHNLEAKNYDFRKGYLGDPDRMISLDDAGADEISKTMGDWKNDIEYNPYTEEIMARPDTPVMEEVDPRIKALDERIQGYEQTLKLREEAGTLNPDIKQAYETSTPVEMKRARELEFYQEMSGCIAASLSEAV